jgi:hypothetical protein
VHARAGAAAFAGQLLTSAMMALMLLSLLWLPSSAAHAAVAPAAGPPPSCTIDASTDGVSLEQAQAWARAVSQQCRASGTTVQLGARSIAVNRSLVLTALDSGTSWLGDGAEVTAAVDLRPALWTVAAADSRMDPAAAQRIMALNLTAAGVPRSSYSNPDETTACVAGGSTGAQTCHLGLLIAPRVGLQMWRRAQPARFPDVPMEWENSPPVNWTHTTSVPNISADGQRAWGFEGNRPRRWGGPAAEGRLFVHGFFWSLWRDARAKILRVDASARQLVANKTVSTFQVGLNTTYYAYGPALLEELTAPGEFAVLGDTLFAIFPADCVTNGAVTCPSRATGGVVDSLVKIQNGAENISLVGLSLTGSQVAVGRKVIKRRS